MQMQHLQGQKAAQINGIQMSTSVRHKCRVVGAQSSIGSGPTLSQPGEARTDKTPNSKTRFHKPSVCKKLSTLNTLYVCSE